MLLLKKLTATPSKAVELKLFNFSMPFFGAVGGAAALIAGSIVRADVVAWSEIGPEAVFRLQVMDLPVIVVIDAFGNDLYKTGQPKFRKQDRR